MDLHVGEGSWLVNTSSRVTDSSIGKIKLHTVVENSSPVSQEVTMDTVYSHVSWAAKLYQAQGVKQKIPLLLALAQWPVLDGSAGGRHPQRAIYLYLAVRIKSLENLRYSPRFLLAFPTLFSCHMQIQIEKHQNRVKYFTWEQHISQGSRSKVAACRICCCYRKRFPQFFDTLLK